MLFGQILEMLRENKLMPYYAAERRIDLFINFFLADILSVYYREEVDFVVSEFPLKHKANSQADKLDYLCAFHGTKQPIFVELKTDVISFKASQAKNYLERAASWSNRVDELKQIIRNRTMRFDYRLKYYRLLMRLQKCRVICMDSLRSDSIIKQINNLDWNHLSRSEKGMVSRLIIELSGLVSPTWKDEARLLYIVPTNENLHSQIKGICKDNVDVLDFSQLVRSDYVSRVNYPQEFQQLARFLNTPD